MISDFMNADEDSEFFASNANKFKAQKRTIDRVSADLKAAMDKAEPGSDEYKTLTANRKKVSVILTVLKMFKQPGLQTM